MFRRIGIVVPHNSHATKSTPTPLKLHQISQKSFDSPLRTKPNYSLSKTHPKNHNKTAQSHTISLLPHLTTLLHKTIINSTQIKKYHLKHYTHTTYLSKFFLTTRTKHKPQHISTQTPNNTKYT